MDGRRAQCVRSLVFHTIGRDNRCDYFLFGVVFFVVAFANISASLQYIRQSVAYESLYIWAFFVRFPPVMPVVLEHN